METFLVASKAALADLTRFERIKVVLGNRTCDLDSAVCSLAQGLLYFSELSDGQKKSVAVIPVMNISHREYRIKTEVVWFLRENGIGSDLITFRNQIDLRVLAEDKRLELTLVDHHTLSVDDLQLRDSVVEVIDHRPQDPNWLWPGTKISVDPVGSCATLVAKNILTRNPKIMDDQLRCLLRGSILVDTDNFLEETARAKPLDHEVIRELEKTSSSLCTREDLYAKILEAKSDVSGLTGEDLLMKDLKVVDKVAIPGFPILVKKFIELPNALEDVLSFTNAGGFTLAILLGMNLKGEKMRRDIGVFLPRTGREHELESALRVYAFEAICEKDSRLRAVPREGISVSTLGALPSNTTGAINCGEVPEINKAYGPIVRLELSDPPEEKMVSSLMGSAEPSLDLRPVELPDETGGHGKAYKFLLFAQENVRATRKQILPIVQSALAHRRC